jgi:integrase
LCLANIPTAIGITGRRGLLGRQAVEDELLPANPALRPGRYLRRGNEPEPEMDPFTGSEATQVIEVAEASFSDWFAFVLCGFRTGMRLGELLALKWSDLDWQGSYIQVQRNLVRGKLTTPKNHQRRKIDMSRQLRAVLRLHLRRQRVQLFEHGLRPGWVFCTSIGTQLDESNVRKVFNRILDKAGLHRRGPHQMRHTFASLLLQRGEPITYVSRQLGHKDASITLRVYAHWLPDTSGRRGVDRLDDRIGTAESVGHPLDRTTRIRRS